MSHDHPCYMHDCLMAGIGLKPTAIMAMENQCHFPVPKENLWTQTSLYPIISIFVGGLGAFCDNIPSAFTWTTCMISELLEYTANDYDIPLGPTCVSCEHSTVWTQWLQYMLPLTHKCIFWNENCALKHCDIHVKLIWLVAWWHQNPRCHVASLGLNEFSPKFKSG